MKFYFDLFHSLVKMLLERTDSVRQESTLCGKTLTGGPVSIRDRLLRQGKLSRGLS